mmetsp:Transcript_18202/g.56020  ORF Transcript_18202/g.56020 Transcript_18202/m.56020 type:complete len:247 (+) Transcript_18202:516-1256(+)
MASKVQRPRLSSGYSSPRHRREDAGTSTMTLSVSAHARRASARPSAMARGLIVMARRVAQASRCLLQRERQRQPRACPTGNRTSSTAVKRAQTGAPHSRRAREASSRPDLPACRRRSRSHRCRARSASVREPAATVALLRLGSSRATSSRSAGSGRAPALRRPASRGGPKTATSSAECRPRTRSSTSPARAPAERRSRSTSRSRTTRRRPRPSGIEPSRSQSCSSAPPASRAAPWTRTRPRCPLSK